MSFFKALGASILKGVDTQIKKKQEDYFNIAQDISEDFEVAKSEAQKLLATAQIKEDALIDEAEFALNKSDKGRKILENASDDDKIVIAKNLIKERNDIGKTNFSYQKFNSAVFSKVFTPDNKYVSPAPARPKTETVMPKVPEFSQTAELLVGMKKPSFNRLLSEIDNPELRDAIQKVRAGKTLDTPEFKALGLSRAELEREKAKKSGDPDEYSPSALRTIIDNAVVARLPNTFRTRKDESGVVIREKLSTADQADVSRANDVAANLAQENVLKVKDAKKRVARALDIMVTYMEKQKVVSLRQLSKEDQDEIRKKGLIQFALDLGKRDSGAKNKPPATKPPVVPPAVNPASNSTSANQYDSSKFTPLPGKGN